MLLYRWGRHKIQRIQILLRQNKVLRLSSKINFTGIFTRIRVHSRQTVNVRWFQLQIFFYDFFVNRGITDSDDLLQCNLESDIAIDTESYFCAAKRARSFQD